MNLVSGQQFWVDTPQGRVGIHVDGEMTSVQITARLEQTEAVLMSHDDYAVDVVILPKVDKPKDAQP